MNDHLKKGAILSLSLLLTTTFSISTAIPAMEAFYEGYSINQVENLVSLPSLAIMLVIMLHPVISRSISRNVSIITGLILLFLTGIMPLFCQDYVYVFISRMLHGIGIGLINVYAVTIINESFSGKERTAMLGYRGAAEILGNIVCTFIVGQILSFGFNWQYSFLIYSASVPILLLYLAYVKSSRETENAGSIRKGSPSASGRSSGRSYTELAAEIGEKASGHTGGTDRAGSVRGYITAFIFFGLCGALIVGINCCNTVRIPSLVIEKGFGAEGEASLIASIRLGAGFLAGIYYWRFEQLLGKKLQSFFFIALGLGELLMAFSSNIVMLLFGTLIVGAAFSVLTTSVFQRSAEFFPPRISDRATTAILVGCNLGSGLASYVLYLIDRINGQMYMSFLIFGILFIPLGIILCFRLLFTSKQN